VVECTALEMRHTGNRIGGSNPSLSATLRPFGASGDRPLRAKGEGCLPKLRQERRENFIGISNPRFSPLLVLVVDRRGAKISKSFLAPKI
jgi:hypothetical protein